MSGPVVKYSIDGTTNAEEVTGRAKNAVSGFEKQIEGIGKRFGNSFKDIFLSFLGPMALLGTAMAFVGKMISDNQKKHEDANQAAINATNDLMSAEDRYYANKMNNAKKDKEMKEEAITSREDVTQQFLNNDPRGKKLMLDGVSHKSALEEIRTAFTNPTFYTSNNKEIQAKVQALIAEDMKNNPMAGGTGPGTPLANANGFSNVIGVGANPVLDAMNEQLVLLKQANDFLSEIARPSGGGVPVDYTKKEPTISK